MDYSRTTKEICGLYGIEPRRSKGQNFLISGKVFDKIVKQADIGSEDIVLEVGPGLGFLTAGLARSAKKVVAVELDDRLAGFLEDAINDQRVENVEIINDDILKVDLAKIGGGELKNGAFKVVANLPYNITSIFLRKFLSENKIKPSLMVLMLQKEVAERVIAPPGEMSLLSCSVQFYAKPEIAFYVPSGNFWPKPEVDSAVIKLKIKDCELKNKDEKNFFQLLKFGFAAKRKMLKNNLSAGLRITGHEAEKAVVSAGLPAKVRAEDLSIDNWVSLFKLLNIKD